MNETKTAPATHPTPVTPQESEFKPYVPPVLGLEDCHHCGLAFDLADTKDKLKIMAQPICLDCRELPWYKDIEEVYLSSYEPSDQIY